jgi:lysophospholipase L1-like esterase
VTVEPRCPAAPLPRAESNLTRAVRSLVVLGDSTPVGIGDPLPGGGWRGFGPLLLDSLGPREQVGYANLSFPGARVADVRSRQVPVAVRQHPDVAVLVVGMNDTLRSDFDPDRLGTDYDAVVTTLRAAGATVLTVRFHDHSQVFWLPGPLRRALRERIDQLNDLTDAVVHRHRIGCLDLHALPGGYERTAWSVDRLHPSELGHRLLAVGFGELIAEAGFDVPHPVSMALAGGREVTAAHHLLWLVFKGLPWLWRCGRDLVPYASAIAFRELRAAPRARGLSVRRSR